MKTILIVEVHHSKPIANLADLVSQRIYNHQEVDDANAWIADRAAATVADLERAGFTPGEISLGMTDVVR